MRFRIGPVPDDMSFSPAKGEWRKLAEPTFGVLMLLAIPVSLTVTAAVLSAWTALARIHGVEDAGQFVITPTTLLVGVLALAALATVHELAHAAALPGFGLSSATVVGFWPGKLTPYVSYEGELARNRYVLTGLTPFLLLSVLPLLIGLAFAWMPLWLVMLSSLNAFVSSGDLIGVGLLLWQAPREAVVRSKGLQTWWRIP
jgi:hypothetical protein